MEILLVLESCIEARTHRKARRSNGGRGGDGKSVRREGSGVVVPDLLEPFRIGGDEAVDLVGDQCVQRADPGGGRLRGPDDIEHATEGHEDSDAQLGRPPKSGSVSPGAGASAVAGAPHRVQGAGWWS